MLNRYYSGNFFRLYFLFIVCSLVNIPRNAIGQIPIFVETFGNTAPGICDQGTFANGFVTSNGTWIVTSTGNNDSAANEWYISATEPGLSINACATPGCYLNSAFTKRTLHVGNVPNSPNALTICLTGDCGAIYDAGGFQTAVETNKRVESPSFLMTGQTTNLLVFNYIELADDLPLDEDKVELYFFDGNAWSPAVLADPPVTTVCGGSSVQWEKFSVLLPVLPADANVKIGFLWKNDNGGSGVSPSFAVDSIIVYNLGNMNANIIASDTDICVNTCIDFFTNASGPYNWIFNGASPSTSTLQNPPSICYSSPGTYSVQLIIGSDTSNVSIAVNPCVAPTTNFAASDTVFCERTCITFSDLSTNGATGWSWSFPGGIPSTSSSPSPPPVCYDIPGLYDVTLITFNQFGSDTLVKTAYLDVNVCPLPVADFSSVPVQFCPQQCVSFTNNSSNGPITSYQWYFPGADTVTSSLANPTVCYSQEGLYDVQLIVSNQFGSDTVIKISEIDVQFLPSAFASPDTEMFSGSTYQLIAGGGVTYLWEPMAGLSNINISNPIASPAQTTTYTVTISDGSGCTSYKQVTITIVHDNGVFVPNTFSPNGDGWNDYLFVRGNNFESIKLVIFDRWGEKIFESLNSTIGWDGTYKGNEVDPGVFAFVVTVNYSNKESFTQSGMITLIR